MKFEFLAVLFCEVVMSTMVGNMELLLVHTVWRHGDRSPTKTFPTDPFQEGNWTFGGGGFGQLSPIGMKQHMNFGKFLRKIYVDDMKFLNERYSSREVERRCQIYVRSTDVNRTIISAMSNILGMYGQNYSTSIPDEDYPSVDGWPVGFVPVAVHTVDDDTDYIGNADADCDRQTKLWDMAKTSPELQAFQNRPDVVALLGNLTKNCGEKIDIDNLWVVRDSLLIEQIHANDSLRAANSWFTDDLFDQMTTINDQVQDYQNGIFNGTLMMNNLDVGLELQKIRGGSLFNDINMHMNIKLDCRNKTTADCKWINGLRYYAYSAHDTTIYALFSIMNIQNAVIRPTGYPDYSAATFIELWLNHSDNKPYFKMSYHQNAVNLTLYPITQLVPGCGGEYCSLDVFRGLAARCKPDQPMDQWCNVDPTTATKSSGTFSSLGLLILTTIAWATS